MPKAGETTKIPRRDLLHHVTSLTPRSAHSRLCPSCALGGNCRISALGPHVGLTVQRPRPPEISSVAKEKSYNKKLIVDGSMPSGSQPTVVSLTPIPS